jgi:hypothetical protein
VSRQVLAKQPAIRLGGEWYKTVITCRRHVPSSFRFVGRGLPEAQIIIRYFAIGRYQQ